VAQDLDTTALLAKVEERQAFLNDVLRYIPKLISEKGVLLKHDIKDCHTVSEYELNDYMGFSFHTHGAFSMYGGENLKVWLGSGEGRKLLLSVDWWDFSEPKVRRFEMDPVQQHALRQMAEGKKAELEIIERQRKEEEAAKQRSAAQEAAAAQAAARRQELARKLPTVAKELGF
jgi:hypothetical protein